MQGFSGFFSGLPGGARGGASLSARYFARSFSFAAAAASFLAFTGCSKVSSSSFDSESVIVAGCPVAQDQRGSFMAKVGSAPLHLHMDATFTATERAGIETAVAQWNIIGRRLMDADFFQLEYTALPASFYADDPRDCNVNSFGNEDTFSVVRETSAERWASIGFSDTIPGATLRCFSDKQVVHQVVMIYINVIDNQQLGSVLTHELGHAIGLDHSCFNGQGSEKFVGCAGLPESHPYHLAVMFPSLRSRRSPLERPEIKDQLQDNDEMRAGCLYRH